MTSYPGENPQPEGTEETQPVGYWERQAAERAGEPAGAQERPADTAATYPQSGAEPGANPYGQQPGLAPYAGQGYPPAPGYAGNVPYAPFAPMQPDHPQATLAMVLGIVGLAGGVFSCGLTLLISPFAWALGRNAVKEIRRSEGRQGGESKARSGMILGIIGTILAVFVILAIIGLVAVGINTDSSPSSTTF